MAVFPKLKDWVTLRDQGLLGALKRRNEKRKETMLQLFGNEGNEVDTSPQAPAQAPADTSTPSAKTETEAERQRRLRKKYGISND